MSRDDFDELSQDVAVNPKKKMTVEKFLQQFNTLDTSNYGGWPVSVKLTCWLFLLLLIAAIGYFLAIKPKLDSIEAARAQETQLMSDFRDKDSKLRNLQQYQAQLMDMQANFNQQLEQLPKETEIPGLVEDINITGVNAGLKFKNIRLEGEIKQEFFIEQPISIEATGDYHAFGGFVTGIAALPRIVTLHDFEILAVENKEKRAEVPVVTYKVNAKTYRYIGTTDAQNPDATQTEGTQ